MSIPDPASSQVVLMGADSYRSMPNLPGVQRNIEALRQLFTDRSLWGLPSDNCITPPLSNAVSTLDVLREAAEKATHTLLVYYAGHGLLHPRANRELYLALPDSDRERLYTALRFETIRQEVLLRARAQRKILILDCCYSGKAIMDGMGPVDVANRTATSGTYVLTACSATKEADAPVDNTYTAFSGELIGVIANGIVGGPPQLDMNTIYTHLEILLPAMGHPAPQARDLNCIGSIPLVRNRAYVTNMHDTEGGDKRSEGLIDSTPSDLVIELRLSPHDAVRGGQFVHRMRRPLRCPSCHPRDTQCGVCHGRGVIDQVRRVEISIPPGAINGSRLEIPNATVHIVCEPGSKENEGWNVPAAQILATGSKSKQHIRDEIRRVITAAYNCAGAPAPRKLAKVAGITGTAIREILSDTGQIRWSDLRKLATALNADVHRLSALVRDGIAAEFECVGSITGPWQESDCPIAGYVIRVATTAAGRQFGTYTICPIEQVLDVCEQCDGTRTVTKQAPPVIHETEAPETGFGVAADILNAVASIRPLPPCIFCKGSGTQPIGKFQVRCSMCKGTGKSESPKIEKPKVVTISGGHTYQTPCNECPPDGRSIARAGRQVVVEIPPGARIGQQLAVRPTEWGPTWFGRAACIIELIEPQSSSDALRGFFDNKPTIAHKGESATFQDGSLSSSMISIDSITGFTGS